MYLYHDNIGRAIHRHTLSTSIDAQTLHRAARLAAMSTDSSIAIAAIVGAQQPIVSQVGLDHYLEYLPTLHAGSLADRVIQRGAPLVVPDVGIDPTLRLDPLVSIAKVGAFLGVPLTRPNGEHVGVLAVCATFSRPWSAHHTDLLTQLAHLTADHLDQRRQLRDAHQQTLTAALEAEEKLVIMDSVADGYFIVDQLWRFVYLNPSATEFFGQPREHLHDITLWDAFPQAISSALEDQLRAAMETLAPVTIEWQSPTTSSWYEIRAFPSARGLVVYLRDISTHKQVMAQLTFHAYHDPLTYLPNRPLFYDRLQQALAHARRQEHRVAVLFVDLDNFKQINDRYGHAVGDAVLVTVAARIRAVLRTEDTAARFGGDEFGIVLPSILDLAGAIEVAERLLATIESPIVIEDLPIRIAASVGIAINDPGLDHSQELLLQADAAMYQAKSAGKGQYAVATTASNRPAHVQPRDRDDRHQRHDTTQQPP